MALVAEYHNSRVCLTERDEAAAQQIIEAHCLDGRSGAIRLALRRQARRAQ